MDGIGKWKRTSTCVAVIATLVVGCGVEPTGSVQGTAYTDGVLAAELREMTLPHTVSIPSDIASLPLPTLLRTTLLPCAIDSTGTHDLNAAGIPIDQLRTFHCETALQSVVITKRGSIRVQATGDDYAARITYADLRTVTSLPSGGVEVSLSGVVDVKAIDRHTLDIHEQVTERIHTPSGSTTRMRDLVRTVTDTAEIPHRGFSITPPVSATIAGTIRLANSRAPGDTLNLTISTPTPLKPDRACLLLGGFRAGELRAVRMTGPAGSVSIVFAC
jgi:hypothetical protein